MRQAVQGASRRDGGHRAGQFAPQRQAIGLDQQAPEEVRAGAFVIVVRRTPGAVELGLAQRLALPAEQALQVGIQTDIIVRLQPQRPAADQRLIENRLFTSVRRLLQLTTAQRLSEVLPMPDTLGVPGGAFAEHCQTRAAVFATLVVMGGGGQQIERVVVRTLGAGLMETFDAGAEVLGIEAHVIARQQHAGAIQRGVFHGLGGHW